jgi:hypothetical protein
MLARHAPIVADVNGETLTLYVLVFCVLPPRVANRSAYCYTAIIQHKYSIIKY